MIWDVLLINEPIQGSKILTPCLKYIYKFAYTKCGKKIKNINKTQIHINHNNA